MTDVPHDTRAQCDDLRARSRLLRREIWGLCPHHPFEIPDEEFQLFYHSPSLWMTVFPTQRPICWCCTASRVSYGQNSCLYSYTITQP